MTVGAIFFDLDDTLCDTLGCLPERMRVALGQVCAARPELQLESLLERALQPDATITRFSALPAAIAALERGGGT
jgi:FMN phosphatase YigB (HAD superfamily)